VNIVDSTNRNALRKRALIGDEILERDFTDWNQVYHKLIFSQSPLQALPVTWIRSQFAPEVFRYDVGLNRDASYREESAGAVRNRYSESDEWLRSECCRGFKTVMSGSWVSFAQNSPVRILLLL
jgi:hypothetical protein